MVPDFLESTQLNSKLPIRACADENGRPAMPCQLVQFSQGIQFRMAGHLGDRADQIDEGLPVGLLSYPGHGMKSLLVDALIWCKFLILLAYLDQLKCFS